MKGQFEPAWKPVELGAEVAEDIADLFFGFDQ